MHSFWYCVHHSGCLVVRCTADKNLAPIPVIMDSNSTHLQFATTARECIFKLLGL